ncbi:MAG TPA: efflux RND transporter periplasmic adaptor subunit [Steroidobacteraceae bacterium]|jgi:membrane fusion protein (multidrug efflux system)|nr:efflux RND transporter periplasmic adaptor subunit [Steroidobacteraceae bacterium]
MLIRQCARAVCALVLGTAVALSAACGGGPRGAPPPGGFKPQVTVVTLKSQSVTLTRELPGRTSAYLVADVRPQVSGLVKRRMFTEGSFVHAGQPLYEIDDSLYRAQYDNVNAALQKAQATEVAANLAARRSAELIKIDAVSAQDNENAIAAERQAQADVAAARAALDTASVNLAYAHITAPISGRIGRSSVTQGALVTADQSTALATIQQLDPLYIDVNQSSSDWLQLKQEIDSGRIKSQGAGTPATIILENGATYAYQGKLQFADVTVDPTTGNFLMRVLVPNPQQLLMPGMYVRAVIDEGVLSQGILAPQQGIQHDPKGDATALIVDAGGKVQQRTVDVTRAVGNQWLIDKGLTAGDRLIVAGVQNVQPGMAVEAVEAAPGTLGTTSTTSTTGATGAPATPAASAGYSDPRAEAAAPATAPAHRASARHAAAHHAAAH